MKICSLYGAGFYYIPGTDTCIKIGGFVRAEYNINSGGSFAIDVNDVYDRTWDDTTIRSRATLTADVRSQTEYGTLRSYFQHGWTVTNGDNAAGALYNNRAFIQLAGFTAGLGASFFDNFSFAAYSNQTNRLGPDTGGGGMLQFGYTAQLGNGLSASIAIEDESNRRTSIATIGYGGRHLPDFVANLRVDQAWGNAQVMGAIHEVYESYVTSPSTHHSNEYGYALGVSAKFNLPMLGKGDNIAAEFVYAKGATGYTFRSGTMSISGGGTSGVGLVTDAVAGTITQGLELTESWAATAGYNHGWNSKWKTSLYGGYGAVNYSDTAEGYLGTAAGLSSDFSFYQIGSRTVWTPVANLDLSVDVMYNHLNSASTGLVAGTTEADKDIWAGIVRAQRNFWP